VGKIVDVILHHTRIQSQRITRSTMNVTYQRPDPAQHQSAEGPPIGRIASGMSCKCIKVIDSIANFDMTHPSLLDCAPARCRTCGATILAQIAITNMLHYWIAFKRAMTRDSLRIATTACNGRSEADAIRRSPFVPIDSTHQIRHFLFWCNQKCINARHFSQKSKFAAESNVD
jgi:hypothetical protein